MAIFRSKIFLLGLGLALVSLSAAKEESRAAQLARKPTVGQRGVTETVASIMRRGRQTLDVPEWMLAREIEEDEQPPVPIDMSGMPVASWPTTSPVMNFGSPYITVGTNFQGPTSPEAGFYPPDTMGGVGPTQIFVTVNGRMRVYDKNGAIGPLDVTSATFFNSVRNGSTPSDPRVYYDPLSQRWFVCMINVTSPNRVMLAVSSGATITSTSSFTFYQFTQDQIGTPGNDAGALFDYPCMGIDNNAVYIGGNMFGSLTSGTPSVFVIRKSSVLSGGPIVVKDFRQLSNISTPYGVSNFDSVATEGYFVGVNTTSTLNIRRVTDPGGNPVLSGNNLVTVPTLGNPSNFTPLGSTSPVDSLDLRTYTAQIKLNRITGVRSLWMSHNTKVNSSGVGSGSGDRMGSRWYQITNMTATPTLVQSGTMFSSGSPAQHFTIPALTSNGQGHAVIGSTTFASNLNLSVAGSFRHRTSPLGTLESPTILQASSSTYNAGFQTSRYRWGDYSQTVVDPNDDMTFWTFQEYCSATNVWSVRCVQIRPPGPASIATLSPATIAQGATQNITITGTSVSGSEFFDPGTGFANRLAAAFSGAGLTVNSVTFSSPTSMTVNVTASAAAATGARDLTVTNPDGQTSVGTGVLTVTSAGNPVPVLASITPVTKVTMSPNFTLTVNGSNFVSGSVVRWNGADRPTTFVNSGQLTATIASGDLVAAGVIPVVVFNPAPGGGTSGSANFTITHTTLSQAVTLLDHIAAGSQPVTVEVRNVGSTTPLQTFTPTLAGGTYTQVLDIAPGNYDVAVRGATWLRKVSTVNFNSATVSGPAVTLWNGDVNGSNLVDIADYTDLATAFDSIPSSPNWNPGADLNGDLVVDIADYTILATSFDLVGDN